MSRRRRRPQVVTRDCRRGCGKRIGTLTGPIHGTQADFDKYSGICYDCLTPAEKEDMFGPMLMRTAKNIQGQYG